MAMRCLLAVMYTSVSLNDVRTITVTLFIHMLTLTYVHALHLLSGMTVAKMSKKYLVQCWGTDLPITLTR